RARGARPRPGSWSRPRPRTPPARARRRADARTGPLPWPAGRDRERGEPTWREGIKRGARPADAGSGRGGLCCAHGRRGEMAKLRVGLVYGGRSVEHGVSLQSPASILRNLDPSRYEVWLLAIDHDGRWRLGAPGASLEGTLPRGVPVHLLATPSDAAPRSLSRARDAPVALDVLYPIVHGDGGEDGLLQGLLELAGIPYVGSGVLGSAIQMDKEVSKRLLAQAGIPVVPWRVVHEHELADDPKGLAMGIVEELGLPLFVKPANSGSSVGIAKVKDVKGLPRALAEATRYDTKLIVERGLDAREIEVAVLGNEQLE